MLFADQLDVLRDRNKDLLNQLRQQRDKLERLGGFNQSRKIERKYAAEERGRPAEVLTLTPTDGGRGAAREALAKPTVIFADTHEAQTNIQQTVSKPLYTFKHSGGNAQQTKQSEIFKGGERHAQVQDRLQDTTPPVLKSCLINRRKEQTEVKGRVTFQSEECKEAPTSNRHNLQPLLGYDWIAGVLDSEDSLIERSDDFFNDLHIFRSLNKDECVHSQRVEFSEQNQPGLALFPDKEDSESKIDTHQCVFSYRINSRLFPVPLHSQECCPVCKKDKSSHPHTTAKPALIRVSIPCSTLLPSYKYRAHRRCSFDPSDSLGLPSHCLSGWVNTGQSTLPPPSSLDLQSSLNKKSPSGLQNKEAEDLYGLSVASNQISDQISDLSRLARHNFRHFSPPQKKLGRSTSYHVS